MGQFTGAIFVNLHDEIIAHIDVGTCGAFQRVGGILPPGCPNRQAGSGQR